MDELEAALGSDMTDVDEVIEALRLDCNTADALLRADFGAADKISCAVLVLVLIIVACAVRSVKKAARSKSIIKRRD